MKDALARGHSRVPVFFGPDRSSVSAFIHLKEQILVNPASSPKVAALPCHPPVWVGPTDSLFGLLNTFQEGQAHMAFVSRHPERARLAVATDGEWPSGVSRCVGVITLEDIIEEILTEEIYDESDVHHAQQTINDFVRLVVRPRLDTKRERHALGFASPETSRSSAELALVRTNSQRLKLLRGKPLQAGAPSTSSCDARVPSPSRSVSRALTAPLLSSPSPPILSSMAAPSDVVIDVRTSTNGKAHATPAEERLRPPRLSVSQSARQIDETSPSRHS